MTLNRIPDRNKQAYGTQVEIYIVHHNKWELMHYCYFILEINYVSHQNENDNFMRSQQIQISVSLPSAQINSISCLR